MRCEDIPFEKFYDPVQEPETEKYEAPVISGDVEREWQDDMLKTLEVFTSWPEITLEKLEEWRELASTEHPPPQDFIMHTAAVALSLVHPTTGRPLLSDVVKTPAWTTNGTPWPPLPSLSTTSPQPPRVIHEAGWKKFIPPLALFSLRVLFRPEIALTEEMITRFSDTITNFYGPVPSELTFSLSRAYWVYLAKHSHIGTRYLNTLMRAVIYTHEHTGDSLVRGVLRFCVVLHCRFHGLVMPSRFFAVHAMFGIKLGTLLAYMECPVNHPALVLMGSFLDSHFTRGKVSKYAIYCRVFDSSFHCRLGNATTLSLIAGLTWILFPDFNHPVWRSGLFKSAPNRSMIRLGVSHGNVIHRWIDKIVVKSKGVFRRMPEEFAELLHSEPFQGRTIDEILDSDGPLPRQIRPTTLALPAPQENEMLALFRGNAEPSPSTSRD